MQTLTKNSQAAATDAHVSILGHITRPELAEYLGRTDVFNGFANRFLWVLVRRSKLLPDGGQTLDLQPLKDQIVEAVNAASAIGRMHRSAKASELWYSIYPKLTAEKPGLYGATTGRGEAQTLRLSMLYALLDRSWRWRLRKNEESRGRRRRPFFVSSHVLDGRTAPGSQRHWRSVGSTR